MLFRSFDPFNEKAMSGKIAEAIEDSALRADLRAHGLKQAEKFSWDQSARQAISAFQKLDSAELGTSGSVSPKEMLSKLVTIAADTVPPRTPDAEILRIAYAMSRLRGDGQARQLLVDVSELTQRDVGTGIQRVTRNILKQLLENPPAGYVVEPVYATGDSWGYLYARHFTARLSGMAC